MLRLYYLCVCVFARHYIAHFSNCTPHTVRDRQIATAIERRDAISMFNINAPHRVYIHVLLYARRVYYTPSPNTLHNSYQSHLIAPQKRD